MHGGNRSASFLLKKNVETAEDRAEDGCVAHGVKHTILDGSQHSLLHDLGRLSGGAARCAFGEGLEGQSSGPLGDEPIMRCTMRSSRALTCQSDKSRQTRETRSILSLSFCPSA